MNARNASDGFSICFLVVVNRDPFLCITVEVTMVVVVVVEIRRVRRICVTILIVIIIRMIMIIQTMEESRNK